MKTKKTALDSLHMIKRSIGEHGWFDEEETSVIEQYINQSQSKLNAIEEVMNEYGSRGGRIGGYNLFGKITKILNRSDSNE